MRVYHCGWTRLQFRSGFWSTFTGRTSRAVADVLKNPSSIDVLVEVTSARLARISSQNSLWQICGMDGLLDITELAQERSRPSDTRNSPGLFDRPSRVSREVRTAFTERLKVVNVESSIGLTVDR